jgi:tetratricopeptide (TPR) repeat protein
MSESTIISQQSDTFEGRMNILKQELELAILWQQSCILMVACNSDYVRAHSVSIIKNFLMTCSQNIVWIHADEPDVHSHTFWDQVLDSPSNTVFFFIDDLSQFAHQPKLIKILNQYSTLFIEKNVRIVFWLTGDEAAVMKHQVPNLWERKNNFIALHPMPNPEQVWQETDEINDELEDTDEKILLDKPSLTELLLNGEATPTRANHLIKLGVLHWRKGDYKNANEILEKALEIATKIQEASLEAECYNALALVKTSIGKHEDAIKAYKQAITLAPNQIFAWNNLGNLCLAINRNHEALIDFQKAIEHNANDAVAWNGLGDVYSRSGYLDDAISSYQKSIEYAPLLPHPWNGLGNIYVKIGCKDEAENAFQKAISLNQHFILPRLGLANLYTKQGKYRDASREYQQALLLEPHNSVVWNEFGCMCLEAAQYDGAIEALTKAIELDQSFGWAYSNLALAHASYGNPQESIPLYLKSLELIQEREQKRLTLNRLADSYRMLKDYDNAIKAYQMADAPTPDMSSFIKNGSNDPQADSVSAADSTSPEARSETRSMPEQAIQQEQNPEEGSPYWIFQTPQPNQDNDYLTQTSSRISNAKLSNVETVTQEIGGLSMQMTLPDIVSEKYSSGVKTPKSGTNYDARMWNEKGNLLFRAGAFEEAIRAYNKAIQFDRSFGWSYTNLGIAYLHLGKYAEAILLLQKSLELLESDKERAIAWNELGNLYRSLNDYHNAVAAYQRADELDPDHAGRRDTVEYLHIEQTAGDARVWCDLGDAFFKAGSHAEAADCYSKAAELEPLNGWAFSNLALSLSMQSKFEEAITYYLKSIELFKSDKEKADAWNRLGNVYRRLDDYENAMAAYQNAVKLNNGNNALLTRARFSLLGNCYVD